MEADTIWNCKRNHLERFEVLRNDSSMYISSMLRKNNGNNSNAWLCVALILRPFTSTQIDFTREREKERLGYEVVEKNLRIRNRHACGNTHKCIS